MIKRSANEILVFLATCGYLSLVPASLVDLASKKKKIGKSLKEKKWTGAGFIGSLVGVFTYFALPSDWAHSWEFLLAGILLSIYVSHYAEKALKSHDDARIVIDEWIGAWIAVVGFGQAISWPVIAAFVLFRYFDAVKKPFIGCLQSYPGGFGVTLDDVAAGVLANICVQLSLLILG